MPTRQRTRTQDRQQRINAERTHNATELALEHLREKNAREGNADSEKAWRGRHRGRTAGYFDGPATFSVNAPPDDPPSDPPPF